MENPNDECIAIKGRVEDDMSDVLESPHAGCQLLRFTTRLEVVPEILKTGFE